MKRILIVTVAILALVPVLIWVGFRIWLAGQPNEFRASIEAFTTREFIEVVADMAFPSASEDRAGAGRRDYPGRGHSPWVMRSSLDGRPRMISLALAPDLWLAYSTETASIHQFWRGEIDFTGPVYDARHGFEPQSRGEAYLRPPTRTGWRIEKEGDWKPAQVQWRGHGFDPSSGQVWLRFELSDSKGPAEDTGEKRTITEWPDHLSEDEGGGAGLFRRFTLSEGPRVALLVDEAPIETGGDDAATREGNRIVFESAARKVEFVQRFPEPAITVRPELPEELANDPFATHDCHTCHNVRERVVGPAWSEIALRYAGANREVTVGQLASRIMDGSVGRWGNVAMIPHPDLSRAEATTLALAILETDPAEAAGSQASEPAGDAGADDDRNEDEATWTFKSNTESPPETLHPSLISTPLDSEDFTPKVGGLAWLPDGRLGVATWDRDGAVFAVDGWWGPPERVEFTRIAEGLHEPLGLAVVEEAIYVMQKQEITQLLDHDGDDWVDEYRTLTNDWRVTSNFHEFGFGLVPMEGHLYGALSVCILTGGKSCRDQTPDRGKVFRASLETGGVEFIASGLRTPNGLVASPSGDLFVTDNQGDWLPASKLIRVRRGADHGWRAPDKGWRVTGEASPSSSTSSDASDGESAKRVSPPTLWLPQNEIGNSPTQPLFLTAGPYAGHVLFGDIFNGGIKRAYLEEVEGELQGAAFHFTGGLEAPVNRLLEIPTRRAAHVENSARDTPDAASLPGGFIAGQIGQGGNWGEFGKDRFGLELLRFKSETAFEPLHVLATPKGFEIHFSRALASDAALQPDHFTLSDWYYIPTEIYGGPKYDLRSLVVRDVSLSRDRRVVSLTVENLKPGRVVYLHIERALRSERDESLWVNEAWYTLNTIPRNEAPNARNATRLERAVQPVSALSEQTPLPAPAPGPFPIPAERADSAPSVSEAPPNRLTEAEARDGWELLFDGESFEGWKIYGAQDDTIEHWVIEDGALRFTRDVSFAGLIWNHLNPFNQSAVDLMTQERFGDFELQLEWKISRGGNSGIFYLVPDETASLAWDLGLEMQVLDDEGHYDGEIERHRAGDLYDLQSLAEGGDTSATRPVGEWNRARIRVQDDHIEHWLNGRKRADIRRGSPAWDAAIAASKFDSTEGFGLAEEGHITLQDHGDVVWYRNLKIKRLDEVGAADPSGEDLPR